MLREVRAAGLGVAIDEADDVDSVLRVLNQLARDQLSDFAGADDQGVLLVGALVCTLAGLPSGRAEDANGQQPERDQRVDARDSRDPHNREATRSIQTPIVTR